MPISNIYGTSTDVDSDESLPPVDPSGNYVDPWDLENYAYLREHLDSSDLPSDLPSDPTSLGDFIEAQSSFDYVPMPNPRSYAETLATMRYESVLTDQGTYACIDELGLYEKTRTRSEFLYDVGPRRNAQHGRHSEISVPVHGHTSSVKYHRERNNKIKKQPAVSVRKYGTRDRSISFAYGDGYETYAYRQGTYSSPKEKIIKEDIYYPIYDDPRSIRKPNNFGLSNYGHLKIDYSYSWNNLNKYIVG